MLSRRALMTAPAGLVACQALPRPQAPPVVDPARFVSATPQGLMLGGAPYRFVGANTAFYAYMGAEGIGDRDPGEAEGARTTDVLGFGAGEFGMERPQSAQFGKRIAALPCGDRGADLIAHVVNRS